MGKARLPITICASIILVLFSAISSLMYLSDYKNEVNTVTIGYDEIEIEEEFTPPPELKQGDNIYKKSVRIKNTGNTDAYVRVFVDFSSKEIDDISAVSTDNGVTFSKLSTFTPVNGWVRNNNEFYFCSYYYYTQPLAPGESTPPLFTHVKTTFENAEDIQQYELLVYAESIQTRDKNGEIPNGFDYAAAWREFLRRR